MASGKLEQLKPKSKIEMFSGSYFAACTLGGIIGESLHAVVR
jgi:solute carrier family 25 (mitochondrial phosphate transporter), member 3